MTNRGRRGSDIHRHIDENLRRAFDKTAQEPVPERFTALLDQLRNSAPADDGSAAGGGGDD